MEKFIALIAVLMLLGLMTNAKSKFEAMSPGFDEEFLHSQNSLTDEQKKLFLELTSLQGDYEKMDLLKIVQTPDLVNQIITVVKEILKKRNVPDKVIDFYVTYLDITHHLEVAAAFSPAKRVSTIHNGFSKTLAKYRVLSADEKEYLYKYDDTMRNLEKMWNPIVAQAKKMCSNPANKAVCVDVVEEV